MGKVGFSLISLATILLSSQVLPAKVIFVDPTAGGAGTGSSWQDAMVSLSSALAAARPGDVIRCAAGLYRPQQTGRTATFAIPSGVVVEGGYAGLSGVEPNLRDIERYRTILTGDLLGDDLEVADPCLLWTEPSRKDNSYNVVTLNNPDPATILDGLVITGGMETRTGNPRLDGGPGGGGGLVINGGSPTIKDCQFLANAGRSAGAILGIGAGVRLIRCTLKGNYAFAEGGAMVIKGGSASLADCRLVGNLAGSDGGALVNRDTARLSVGGTTISGNRCAGHGGGIFVHNGNVTVEHSILAGNKAGGNGGAVKLGDAATTADRLSMSFCTITGNKANAGGAVHWPVSMSTPPVVVSHCIIWANSPGVLYPGWAYNCLSDPLFAAEGRWDQAENWIDGDYHLKSQSGRWDPLANTWVQDEVTSPCIDAGDPAVPVGQEPFPNGGIVNVGTYAGTSQASKSYLRTAPCQTIVAGDINGDCQVDAKDLQLLALHWLSDWTPKVYLRWLGHAAFKVWTDQVVIYIDPYRITDSPHDATYVLCTHTHSDHFSAGDIARVAGPATQLIGPPDVIGSYGKGMAMAVGQTIELGPVKIKAVPAYNTNKPNHPKANNWLGFVIEIAGKRLYHAGDTDVIEEMKTLGPIDVAMLPIGGTYTMNAAEAAIATTYIQPRLAIPMHWGTIVGTAADAQTFAQKAACQVLVMSAGQTIEL